MVKKEKNSPAQTASNPVVKPAKRKPVHVVKIPFNGGLLSASIWRHQKDQGHPWFSVSLSHARKNANGKWVYGDNNFSRDELLGLVRVIEVAHGHIVTGIFNGGTDNE